MTRCFLDTNILVYSFDRSCEHKRVRARELVAEALSGGDGMISFQVVQEFLNVAGRKFARPLSRSELQDYLRKVLAPLCTVFSSVELCESALDVRERWQFSFYDSLIVAAALQAGCELLYTEDLQHGQKVRELTITDPFRVA